MKDSLENQVRELEQRLERLEQQLSDERREEARRRRRATLSRIGLMLFMGAAYAWYLVKVTSII